MITREFADHFAKEWIDSWNSHNLERILSHYTDDFEMASPYIAQIAGEPSGVLKGKAAVAAYWAKALEHVPTLHFELHSTLVGAESLVIYYQGVRGMAAELFFFRCARKGRKSLRPLRVSTRGPARCLHTLPQYLARLDTTLSFYYKTVPFRCVQSFSRYVPVAPTVFA